MEVAHDILRGKRPQDIVLNRLYPEAQALKTPVLAVISLTRKATTTAKNP
jgi:hypothetical protein